MFETVKLPDGKVLIPGVIESKSNFIEHPELIAQRIGRYAKLVGRENVIAGSDCGYGTWVGQAAVDPDVVWAKLAAMAEGARIASQAVLELSFRSRSLFNFQTAIGSAPPPQLFKTFGARLSLFPFPRRGDGAPGGARELARLPLRPTFARGCLTRRASGTQLKERGWGSRGARALAMSPAPPGAPFGRPI